MHNVFVGNFCAETFVISPKKSGAPPLQENWALTIVSCDPGVLLGSYSRCKQLRGSGWWWCSGCCVTPKEPVGWVGVCWEPTVSETFSLPGKRRAVCAESISWTSPQTLGPLPKPHMTAMILEGGRPGLPVIGSSLLKGLWDEGRRKMTISIHTHTHTSIRSISRFACRGNCFLLIFAFIGRKICKMGFLHSSMLSRPGAPWNQILPSCMMF